MFLFYMAPLVPFLILGADARARRRCSARRSAIGRRRAATACASSGAGGASPGSSIFLALVVADFVWMWPIFTGGLLTYDQWHAHMWLPSWV